MLSVPCVCDRRNVNAVRAELTKSRAASCYSTTFARERLVTKVRLTFLQARRSELVADLSLASVDHVIERLIMTVIETCSAGAVVCVSLKIDCRLRQPRPRIRTRELTRGLPPQIVDIIVFTIKPETNLHFLFALVSSLLLLGQGPKS